MVKSFDAIFAIIQGSTKWTVDDHSINMDPSRTSAIIKRDDIGMVHM
jgi:hypothetical protein